MIDERRFRKRKATLSVRRTRKRITGYARLFNPDAVQALLTVLTAVGRRNLTKVKKETTISFRMIRVFQSRSSSLDCVSNRGLVAQQRSDEMERSEKGSSMAGGSHDSETQISGEEVWMDPFGEHL